MARHFLIADPRTGLVVRREVEPPTKVSTVNLRVFRVNKATWLAHSIGAALTLAPGPTLDNWNSAMAWWTCIRATAAEIVKASQPRVP